MGGANVEATPEQTPGRSLAKGFLAGLIGGLAGTVAKTFAERMFPAHTHGDSVPEEVTTAGHLSPSLTSTTHTAAADAIQWSFGAAAGAVYGALAEFYPVATAKGGASFGLALATLTHEGGLPALGLSAEPEDGSIRERTSEMTSHVVYGLATETVRGWVRRLL
jgi:putative membrane protein